ncbi:hypothetical protein BC940DRAFT_309938 [Gongronella butleri]|nr:hypothetical protein BC940DRAFT_309938 [Gongronella butleri]
MRITLLSSLVLGYFASCNAVAVHSWWSTPSGVNITEMRSSITVPKGSDPVNTYWMSCGFGIGYMGMQVNSPTERRVLFSIWDNGKGSKVDVLKTGKGVEAGDFGGEGTGRHAYINANWTTDHPVYFRVQATVDEAANAGIFTGHYRKHNQKNWNLIAQFKAEEQPVYLTGLYSFLENFGGNTTEVREGYWANNSIKDTNGKRYKANSDSFTNTTPNGQDIWDQRLLNKNQTAYMRIDGSADQGIYKPKHIGQ